LRVDCARFARDPAGPDGTVSVRTGRADRVNDVGPNVDAIFAQI
jgi:hypothetical protein